MATRAQDVTSDVMPICQRHLSCDVLCNAPLAALLVLEHHTSLGGGLCLTRNETFSLIDFAMYQ